MNVNEMYPGKWIKSDDLADDDLHLTITNLTMEMLGLEDEEQPVLWFDQTTKGLPLNKTNATTIATLHGPETDAWIGQSVTLYRVEVEFQGRTVWGVRVRLTVPEAAELIETVEEDAVPF